MARHSRLAAAGIAMVQVFLGAPRPSAAQACPDPKPADFAKETLIGGDLLNQPIELAVAAGLEKEVLRLAHGIVA